MKEFFIYSLSVLAGVAIAIFLCQLGSEGIRKEKLFGVKTNNCQCEKGECHGNISTTSD